MFKIGDFSKLTQVSVRMLRYYDELGLLKPAEVDRFTGYRFYSARQINRLNRIISLRDMGFMTAEIDDLLSQELDNQSLLRKLKDKQAELEGEIAAEEAKLHKLRVFMNVLGKENSIVNTDVIIKKIPACKVVSRRRVIPEYNQEGILWGELSDFVQRNEIPCGDASFAVYHDQDYKEKDVDVEVVMAVKTLQEDREGFTFREMEPVNQMASLMVNGPYENIAQGYNTLGKWVEDNGYVIAGNARQVCHKGPWNESSPENYLTEVQIPVTKAK